MAEEQQPVEQVQEFSPEAFMGDSVKPEATVEPTPQEPAPPAPVPEEPAPADEVKFDEYWTALKEEVGELDPELVNVFKNGKDAEGNPLTAKAKLNLLKDFVLDNVLLGGSEESDSFIRDYMAAANTQEFNRKEWLQKNLESQNFMELPSKDFLKTYYKRYSENNKLNWSEQDINSKVEAMSVIDADMQASQLKGQYKAYLEQQRQVQSQEQLQKIEQQVKENLVKTNDSIKADLQGFISQAQAKKVIGGFEFGDADKKDFLENLPKFVEKKIVDLGNGQRIIASEADLVLEEIKAKPEMSLNMLPYLYLVKNKKIDGYMSRIIQSKTREIEGKLDDNPEIQLNRGGSQSPGFDPNAFMGKG